MHSARLLLPAMCLVLAACVGNWGHARGVRERGAGALDAPTLVLSECVVPGAGGTALCGELEVPENRNARRGRTLRLAIVVLPAVSFTPAPDPVYVLAGGPGGAATTMAALMWQSPMRADRSIVLVDQRGSNRAHRLDCQLPGSDSNPAGYMESVFQPAVVEACRRRLEARADLRWYSTDVAMQDLDDARRALGHATINLYGISYGTRAALAYIRRYEPYVRSAILNGPVPPALKNPLYHASAAQEALDALLEACARDESCNTSFPGVRDALDGLVARLRREPVRVTVPLPALSDSVKVTFTAEHLGEALRTTMYSSTNARAVPAMIHFASQGDFRPVATQALLNNRSARPNLPLGMLLSVTCSEDVARISDAEIVREAGETLVGDTRVRQQVHACHLWPQSSIARAYSEPVKSRVPVFILSGAYDPVVRPRWGEETARHLPNSRHVVIPRGHSPRDGCIEDVFRAFLHTGDPKRVDLTCVDTMKLMPFALPGAVR